MSGKQYGVIYTLTLQEPVLVSSLGGEPNSANSLFYIPGGAVRGAFIQKFGGEPKADDEQFRRLFLSGETRFLNAYPLLEGKRSLPSPLTWQTKRKSPEKMVYRNADCAPLDEKTKKKIETTGVKFDFWTRDGDILFAADETWQVNVHTQRDAEHGRAIVVTDPDHPEQKSTLGTVYRYIALPAGTKLQGVVLTQPPKDKKTPDDATFLRSLFGKKATILLGKARTAGYGTATLEIDDLKESWREYEPVSPKDGKITLTLLSPALVRDENGQYGLEIAPALPKGVSARPVSRNSVIIAGFNRKWGLPLPQATAIAAGSVFIVTNATLAQIQAIEERGIGERRAEGFGCVAFNLDLPGDAIQYKNISPVCKPASTGSLDANDRLAALMLTRLMRRDLDEAILQAARLAMAKDEEGQPVYRPGTVPSSQLSRWQGILRDSIGKIGTDVVEDGETKKFNPIRRMKKFCEDNKGKPGWKKMEKARIKIEGKPIRLTEWIESALETPKALYQASGLAENYERRLGPNSVKMEDFNDEYRLRLLDAVLAVMSKNNGKGGANG